MTIFSQKPWSLEFLISEARGTTSRDVVTIASGSGVVQPGTVIAHVTATGKYVPAVLTATDGSQTAVGVTGYYVDATSADATVTAFLRTCEVTGNALTRDASIATALEITAQNAQLAAVGVMVR